MMDVFGVEMIPRGAEQGKLLLDCLKDKRAQKARRAKEELERAQERWVRALRRREPLRALAEAKELQEQKIRTLARA